MVDGVYGGVKNCTRGVPATSLYVDNVTVVVTFLFLSLNLCPLQRP